MGCPSQHFSSEKDFGIILNRVEELNIGVNGIEIWTINNLKLNIFIIMQKALPTYGIDQFLIIGQPKRPRLIIWRHIIFLLLMINVNHTNYGLYYFIIRYIESTDHNLYVRYL